MSKEMPINSIGRDERGQHIPHPCTQCFVQPACYGLDGWWYCTYCWVNLKGQHNEIVTGESGGGDK